MTTRSKSAASRKKGGVSRSGAKNPASRKKIPAAPPPVAPGEKREHGRPSVYSPELADTILRRVSAGERVVDICRDDHMPCHATVFLWDEEDREGFSERMQRARRMAAHFLSEQRLAIADETSRDTLVDEKGYERANNEWIQRSKLRCDVRRDLAAKWNPKRYGERTQFEDITPPAPDDELNKRIAELLQKGKAK